MTARCNMGVGCDEAGVCYAAAHGEPERCPHFVNPARRFYVTLLRGPKVGYLLGPFETEARAREHIPAARHEAERVDPRTVFDAFGTCSVTGGPYPVGVLNDRCGAL